MGRLGFPITWNGRLVKIKKKLYNNVDVKFWPSTTSYDKNQGCRIGSFN